MRPAVAKWARRAGAAALVAAAVLGCGGGCRSSAPPVGLAPSPTAARPPGLAAATIVGAWRLTVSGDAGAMVTFWPGGLVATTDPGMGTWRPRTAGPGDVEGCWEIPLAGLSVTFVIVVNGNSFTGTGIAVAAGGPSLPITMTGSRVAVAPGALAQVSPPRT